MTTDYTDATATELLATHCCLCGRALLDAASVERGLGPTCAEKAGVGEAAHEADWTRALAVLAAVTIDGASLSSWSCDARAVCNALVHRVGRDPLAAEVPAIVEAIEALGYLKLAATLADRLVPVTVRVEAEGEALVVSADLPRGAVFEAFLAEMRRVPGRRWNSERKVDIIPAKSRKHLFAALLNGLPEGAVIVGTRVVVIHHDVAA